MRGTILMVAVVSCLICVASEASDCPTSWVGDGYCDAACNLDEHDFDGGDCCPGTCRPRAYACGTNGYDCLGSCGDTDGDGVCTSVDNCWTRANADQRDRDEDGVGDVCDNCLCPANPEQENADGDAFGDACDLFPRIRTLAVSIQICGG